MTARNTILLIIRQNNGIDYNSLLNKISPNYTNTNSARAALSRAIKDLLIRDLIIKKENNFTLSEKGESNIYSEMKNKLVLKLNELIKSKNPINEIDSIVQQLQVLIERAKSDSDLLKISKSGVTFSIGDLIEIIGELSEKTKHLNYLSTVLQEQINALKNMDFNDYVFLPLSINSFERIENFALSNGITEIIIETTKEELLSALSTISEAKQKEKTIILPTTKLKDIRSKLMETILNSKPLETIQIFMPPFKTTITTTEILFFGPFQRTQELR